MGEGYLLPHFQTVSRFSSIPDSPVTLRQQLGGTEGSRTLYLCIASAALSQLSYGPRNHPKEELNLTPVPACKPPRLSPRYPPQGREWFGLQPLPPSRGLEKPFHRLSDAGILLSGLLTRTLGEWSPC